MPQAKATNKQSFLLLLLGFCLLLPAVIWESYGQYAYQKHRISEAKKAISAHIYRHQEEIKLEFEGIKSAIEVSESKNKDIEVDWTYFNSLNQFKLYLFDQQKLIYWSSQNFQPDLAQVNFTEDLSTSIVQLENGLALQNTQLLSPDILAVSLLPLQQQYPMVNHYLKNHLLIEKEYQNLLYITQDLTKADFGLDLPEINERLYFKILPLKDFPLFGQILYILGILSILLGLHLFLLQKLKKGHFTQVFGFMVVVFGTVFWLWKVAQKPTALFDTALFSPHFYAGSEFLASTGDLLIASLLLFWVLRLLCFQLLRQKVKHWLPGFLLVLANVVLLFGFTYMLKDFSTNSNLLPDLKNLYNINPVILPGVYSVFILFYTYFFFSYSTIVSIEKIGLSTKKRLFAFLLLLFFCFLWAFSGLFQNVDLIFISVLFCINLLFSYLLFYEKISLFNYQLGLLLLVTICIGSLINHYEAEKEKEDRKILAASFAKEQDPVTEYLFNNVAQKIQKDDNLQSCLKEGGFDEDALSEYLRENYFGGYFSKYKIIIEVVDTSGVTENQTNKAVLTNQARFTFYQSDREDLSQYMAIFEPEITTQNFLIKLSHQPYFKESIYPELIDNQANRKKTAKFRNYDYGLYENKKLFSQQGSYAYTLTLDHRFKSSNTIAFKSDSYGSHLVYRINEVYTIVISKAKEGIIYQLGLLSFLFLLFSLLFLLHKGLNRLLFRFTEVDNSIEFRNAWPGDLLFRTKIQMAILGAAVIGITTISMVTFTYLKNKYEENERQDLLSATQRIVNELNEIYRSNQHTNVQKLSQQLQNMSAKNRLDINFFDLEGQLLYSSQPYIYEEGILAPLLQPEAFERMFKDQKAHHFQHENIGKLHFLSAYAMISDQNFKPIGVLQLPYFGKEAVLKKEISSLFVTLINIYALIIAILLLLSFYFSGRLTAPLGLIKEKIGQIALGQKNQPIHYPKNDEIGALVNRYNEMLAELEENVEKLARSEREGAWREMAKQVAHEIKNPLTPMKLNVQLLKRQFKGEHKVNIDKICSILIKQIEHLAHIATEFSNFAKTPEADLQPIAIHPILSDTLTLFAHHEGIGFSAKMEHPEVYIMGDQSYLQRIFTNLIKNAIQAIPEDRKGEIKVVSELSGKELTIAISDNGSGIAPEDEDRIFKPNFSTKSEGLGMGLAMVKNMVSYQNGKIYFTTSPEGTTFYLKFEVISPSLLDENS